MGELGVCVLSKRGSHVCVCGHEESFLYVLFAWAMIQLPFTTPGSCFLFFLRLFSSSFINLFLLYG